MRNYNGRKTIKAIGIDLAKSVFHLHGVDAQGRGQNIAAVALANKIVRTAWVLIIREEEYRTHATTM